MIILFWRCTDRRLSGNLYITQEWSQTWHANVVEMKKVLIIGGGTAGISAALSLAQRGVPSIVVEKKIFGGMAEELACKGKVECVRCDVCLAHDKVKEMKLSPLIEMIGPAELQDLEGEPGSFKATVLLSSGRKQQVAAASIILSIGLEPFDPGLDKRLGYGSVAGVITAFEAEKRLLQKGNLALIAGKNGARSIAFIQCVGSRDSRFGMDYCSRVCCKYSLKLAQLLKKLEPDLRMSYYFMDWRPCDAQDDLYAWAESQNDVELVRSRPSEIVLGDDRRPEVRFTSPLGENVGSMQHDIVILSQGVRPAIDAGQVCDKLGLERDESGFVKSYESEPCRTNKLGIFAAGCIHAPMDLVDSVKDGAIAAGKAYSFLEGIR